jgi:hypothetical protein
MVIYDSKKPVITDGILVSDDISQPLAKLKNTTQNKMTL